MTPSTVLRRTGLLVGASLFALMSGTPGRAQAPSQVDAPPLRVLVPAPAPEFTIGKRIDASQTRDAT